MNKIVSLILLICLLFTGMISYRQVLDLKSEKEKASAESGEAFYNEPQPVEIAQVDLEALYASRDPGEVVGAVDGREVTWQEYFYFYSGYVSEVQNLLSYMGAYGYSLSWDDEYEEGVAFSAIPAENAVQAIRQYSAIEAFAQEKEIMLSTEEEEALHLQLLADAERYCGEGATETQLEEYLSTAHLPIALYRQMLYTNAVYQKLLTELYGGESEDGTHEAALSEALVQALADISFVPAEGFSAPDITAYLI